LFDAGVLAPRLNRGLAARTEKLDCGPEGAPQFDIGNLHFRPAVCAALAGASLIGRGAERCLAVGTEELNRGTAGLRNVNLFGNEDLSLTMRTALFGSRLVVRNVERFPAPRAVECNGHDQSPSALRFTKTGASRLSTGA
jgi:hypothetical protein